MRRLRRGVAPAALGLPPAVLGLLGLAVILAGCATSTAEPTAASQSIARADRDATEDDGLPPQVAPSARIRQMPDDPREPFSRNYGPQSPGERPTRGARMSEAEADALIARAITAHEIRRP